MPKKDEPMTFMVEGTRLIYRNFAGKIGPYNATGQREFSVVLPMEEADRLASLGWNVKIKEPQEEGDEPFAFITVKVNFKFKPPRIVIMTTKARTQLDEDGVAVLDYADINFADVICNASYWTTNGKSGISAYCKSLFVQIEEDALEQKYAINEVD